ncbi:hypothetical protein PT286_03200 [Neisseriaceae bacterium ESL0693]|nr:hypothetical protein [Neisseriaceae bacterium ESL0693]
MQIITLSIILIYVALFVWQCIRHQAWRWLWVSALVWWATGLFTQWLMPDMTGTGHTINLYLVHFYILAGSLIYIGSNRLRSDRNAYLYYLARSGWLQYLALGVWLIFSLLSLHQPWLLPIGSSLLQMILVQPLFWLGSQWILMGLLYLRDHDPMLSQAWRKQSFLAWVILWQALYVFADIYGFM